jgi:hypothetical protein
MFSDGTHPVSTLLLLFFDVPQVRNSLATARHEKRGFETPQGAPI